jgi:hypothetical protein
VWRTNNAKESQIFFDEMDEAMRFQKTAIICTMPKSGTWYCRYFYHFLQHLLRGSQQIPVAIDNTAQVVAVPELALDVYGIFHAAFPGFDSYHGPLRRSWETLQHHLAGYDMFGHRRPHNKNSSFQQKICTPNTAPHICTPTRCGIHATWGES